MSKVTTASPEDSMSQLTIGSTSSRSLIDPLWGEGFDGPYFVLEDIPIVDSGVRKIATKSSQDGTDLISMILREPSIFQARNARSPTAHAEINFPRTSPFDFVASPVSFDAKFDTTTIMFNSRELPVPTVPSITSLNQAHATLLHCWNRIWKSGIAAIPGQTTQEKPILDFTERRELCEWLEKWEKAFTEYLATAMTSMGQQDLTQCRVLKANHLGCTILASGSEVWPESTFMFEDEFRAIIELAGAVLQARETMSPQSASTASPVEPTPQTSGLDVHMPLSIVIMRCQHAAIRERAHILAVHSRGF
ncbi:hypothetical protein LTR86_008293 [Recurvomyces mirabilis]|nr:hypothetical protein LTR86_008293 [Recurvomyces mirabilis]